MAPTNPPRGHRLGRDSHCEYRFPSNDHPPLARVTLASRRRSRTTQVPLRAEIVGATHPDMMWEVDGRAIQGHHWNARPGRHTFVAIWNGRRSDMVEVEIVQTGEPTARSIAD